MRESGLWHVIAFGAHAIKDDGFGSLQTPCIVMERKVAFEAMDVPYLRSPVLLSSPLLCSYFDLSCLFIGCPYWVTNITLFLSTKVLLFILPSHPLGTSHLFFVLPLHFL